MRKYGSIADPDPKLLIQKIPYSKKTVGTRTRNFANIITEKNDRLLQFFLTWKNPKHIGDISNSSFTKALAIKSWFKDKRTIIKGLLGFRSIEITLNFKNNNFNLPLTHLWSIDYSSIWTGDEIIWYPQRSLDFLIKLHPCHQNFCWNILVLHFCNMKHQCIDYSKRHIEIREQITLA